MYPSFCPLLPPWLIWNANSEVFVSANNSDTSYLDLSPHMKIPACYIWKIFVFGGYLHSALHAVDMLLRYSNGCEIACEKAKKWTKSTENKIGTNSSGVDHCHYPGLSDLCDAFPEGCHPTIVKTGS